MLRIIFIFLGAVLGIIVAYLAVSLGLSLYATQATSDEAISQFGKILILLWPLLTIAGGWAGYQVHKKYLISRSIVHRNEEKG
jgi:hypothetical protein